MTAGGTPRQLMIRSRREKRQSVATVTVHAPMTQPYRVARRAAGRWPAIVDVSLVILVLDQFLAELHFIDLARWVFHRSGRLSLSFALIVTLQFWRVVESPPRVSLEINAGVRINGVPLLDLQSDGDSLLAGLIRYWSRVATPWPSASIWTPCASTQHIRACKRATVANNMNYRKNPQTVHFARLGGGIRSGSASIRSRPYPIPKRTPQSSPVTDDWPPASLSNALAGKNGSVLELHANHC